MSYFSNTYMLVLVGFSMSLFLASDFYIWDMISNEEYRYYEVSILWYSIHPASQIDRLFFTFQWSQTASKRPKKDACKIKWHKIQSFSVNLQTKTLLDMRDSTCVCVSKTDAIKTSSVRSNKKVKSRIIRK